MNLDHAYVGHLYEGKLVVDKTYGHAAYWCGNCCGYNPPPFDPLQFGGPPDEDFTETVDSLEACSGGLVDVTGGGYGWGSTKTAVATLPTKVLHTVAVGSATGSSEFQLEAEHPYPKCLTPIFGPTQSVNVQVPTASVIVNQTSSGPNTSCPSGQPGWSRQVLKEVVDQYGNAVAVFGQNLDETVSITAPNQLNLKNPQTGTAVTNGGGQFSDTFFDCSAFCPGSGQTDASQVITDVLPNGSGPYSLSPNSLVYGCSSITINGK